MKYYSISEFAKIIKVTEQTLRNWDKKGTFKPNHTTNYGKRFYSQEQLDNYVKTKSNTNVNPCRQIIGYCRVSSSKQKDDLERQVNNVKTYMYAKGYQFKIISDIGSGINYNKKGLLELLELIESNEVEKIVILYKDRLLTTGYDLFYNICKYHNTEIEIIDNTDKTDEQELVEDLVQIITVFSCKLHGKRVKKTKQLVKELLLYDTSN